MHGCRECGAIDIYECRCVPVECTSEPDTDEAMFAFVTAETVPAPPSAREDA